MFHPIRLTSVILPSSTHAKSELKLGSSGTSIHSQRQLPNNYKPITFGILGYQGWKQLQEAIVRHGFKNAKTISMSF